MAPIKNYGQGELSSDTNSPHSPTATIHHHFRMPMIFLLVSPVIMCIIAQLWSSREQRKPPLPPAPVTTQKHSPIGAFQHCQYSALLYHAGSGLARTKSRTHRGLGSYLQFLVSPSLFFPLRLVVEPWNSEGLLVT